MEFQSSNTGQPLPGVLFSRMRHFSLCVCVLLAMVPAIAAAEAIVLSASPQQATAGYFQLDWVSEVAAGEYQLQESRVGDFSDARIIYQGADTASVISGLGNGEYVYRIRRADTETKTASQWSQPVRVIVEHHPLGRAFGFFFVGLVVFLSILVAIIRGARQLSR